MILDIPKKGIYLEKSIYTSSFAPLMIIEEDGYLFITFLIFIIGNFFLFTFLKIKFY